MGSSFFRRAAIGRPYRNGKLFPRAGGQWPPLQKWEVVSSGGRPLAAPTEKTAPNACSGRQKIPRYHLNSRHGRALCLCNGRTRSDLLAFGRTAQKRPSSRLRRACTNRPFSAAKRGEYSSLSTHFQVKSYPKKAGLSRGNCRISGTFPPSHKIIRDKPPNLGYNAGTS